MFILHVKHYFFQEILKVHSLQKKMQNQHFITFTSGKLQDFWSSGFGFRQGLRQRSVSREALGPRMKQSRSPSMPVRGLRVGIALEKSNWFRPLINADWLAADSTLDFQRELYACLAIVAKYKQSI
jgi:hypothetical protein